MREFDRIERILDQIKMEWEKHQDLRLFQLLYKLQFDYANSNNGRGKIEGKEGKIGFDNFYWEDDELEEFLKEWKL
ncbi:MAG: hypothetical protein Crog4KO_01730 [Crocinitomicaceae bacterium]